MNLQLVVVTTPTWDAVEGVLQCYERSSLESPWEKVGPPVAINVGKNGMSFEKREGDGKSPVGLFSLGPVFGDAAHQGYSKNMPFLLIEEDLECVDDPDSRHYNRFVRSDVECDWKSSEKMAEVGALYALGIVVGYNMDPIHPGKGSCIFMHVWSGPGRGTAGCTALDRESLIALVSWLDAKKQPCLVQGPGAVVSAHWESVPL